MMMMIVMNESLMMLIDMLMFVDVDRYVDVRDDWIDIWSILQSQFTSYFIIQIRITFTVDIKKIKHLSQAIKRILHSSDYSQ